MKPSIIVDSCCDMTPELRDVLDVTSVPLTMRLGQDEYTDDKALDLPAFMEHMKACRDKVGSAAPAPSLYQEAMEGAQQSFVVTLSSQLSSSYANAAIGKEMAECDGNAQVHIFDSKSASAGETLLAIKVHELLAKGLSLDGIVQEMNRFIANMKTYFVLERYDNLQKNGRLSRVTGKLISLLNMKLVMGADADGAISLYEKVRGTNQMIAQLLSYIESINKKTDAHDLVISHCNHMDLAEQLKAAVEKRFHFKKIWIVPTGGLSSMYADDKGIVMAF